jgi:hypothetical protein
LLPALVGCANTFVYQHTTSVTASATELNITLSGDEPAVHVQDGRVEVVITTAISITNQVE